MTSCELEFHSTEKGGQNRKTAQLKPHEVTPNLNRLDETVQMRVTTYVFMQN